jgi:hypothetical protein
MGWKIKGDQEPSHPADLDAQGWLWAVEDASGNHKVIYVQVTGQGADHGPAASKAAAASRGRSGVEAVLTWAEPPDRIDPDTGSASGQTTGGRER